MLVAATVAGFTAVALGAFGAHALGPRLEAMQRLETWKTATLYHLVHAVALLAVAVAGRGLRVAAWCWVAGTILFSGSLYLLALTGLGYLGAITPCGGVLLLAGWLALLLRDRNAP